MKSSNHQIVFFCVIVTSLPLILPVSCSGNDGLGNINNSNYSGFYVQPGIPALQVQDLPLTNYYGLVQSALELESQPYELSYHPSVYSVRSSQPPVYSEEQKVILLNDALRAAWDQYGPKNKQGSSTNFAPASAAIYAHPGSTSTHGVPLTGFQPSDSEWDDQVTKVVSTQPHPPVTPNMFSQFLSSYIDFEVNHHEVADFIRRAVALVFIGVLILAWITLGAFLGLFPLKAIFGIGRAANSDDAQVRMDTGKGSKDDLASRVYIALEGDWLRKLQNRVENEFGKKSGNTFVQCCIQPGKESKGVADCRILERTKQKHGMKCPSDLKYNFDFGPNLKTENQKKLNKSASF